MLHHGVAQITIAGTSVYLLPHRAMYWPDRRTVLIADLHIGKAAAFRAGGVPIPRGTTDADLKRLDETLSLTGGKRLVILGDLYHAAEGMAPETIEQFQRWRDRRPDLVVDMVRGNHDFRAGPSPRSLLINEHESTLADGPFVFRHHPMPSDEGYVLSGHLHPAARLKGRGVRSLRLPCFHFGDRVGVLPAFGTFTGTAVVRPKRGDAVFVVAGGEVVKVGDRG